MPAETPLNARSGRIVAVTLLVSVLAFAAAPAGASPGTTERVSVSSAGTQGNGDSVAPSISADGRFVAFLSCASNFVPGDTNVCDVYVHDRQTGTTEGVGLLGPDPSISASGRFVASDSLAPLVPGDTNDEADVFVHDRQTGTTERVSVDSAGNEANDFSLRASISGDGRFVAFQSFQIFVHDRRTGTTEPVSVDSAGTPGNTISFAPSISATGRFVAFTSFASNLVPGDTNRRDDVFVHDRANQAEAVEEEEVVDND